MSEQYIVLDNVSFSYEEGGDPSTPDNRKKVFEYLNLSIEKGSFVALLGHNGSGKSTLAKLICGILLPDKGSVHVGSTEVSDPELPEEQLLELRRRVGIVFQNPDNQLVATVVEEDIAFGPENLGIPPLEIRERVDKVMELLDLTAYAKHSPSKLSGGQKQRVAVAGILAMQPECMVFDEATAMLDPKGRKEVMDTVKKLNRELGITVIHITHNMDEAMLADRVVVMDGGNMVLDGSPDFVFGEVEVMHQIGLEVPQSAELLYELSKAGVDVAKGLVGEEECAGEIYRCYKSTRI